MKRLSKEQILMLHSQLIEQTGGTAQDACTKRAL